jgi:hypothetical protein
VTVRKPSLVTYGRLARVSVGLGIALILFAAIYKQAAIGPYQDQASNVISSSYVGEVVMIGGAVIAVAGACAFRWLGRSRDRDPQ